MSIGPGVSFMFLGNFRGVPRRNSCTISIIALVVVFTYVGLGIFYAGDWRIWIISDTAYRRYVSGVTVGNGTCLVKNQQCLYLAYFLWKVFNT